MTPCFPEQPWLDHPDCSPSINIIKTIAFLIETLCNMISFVLHRKFDHIFVAKQVFLKKKGIRNVEKQKKEKVEKV